MSENNPFGFGKFVPGFDFLQNISKGSQGMHQMPALSNWVAPTLNVEEVEKRISELKAVLFWLDQNRQALGATIQALEVQKMTLATLKGMNFSMNELSEALMVRASGRASKAAPDQPQPEEAATAAPQAGAKPKASARKDSGNGAGSGAAIDPLQWWGALTQQFQQIATAAMEAAHKTPSEPAPGQVAAAAVTAPAKAAKSAKSAPEGGARRTPRKAAPRKATASR
jgi:hypothetical protein